MHPHCLSFDIAHPILQASLHGFISPSPPGRLKQTRHSRNSIPSPLQFWQHLSQHRRRPLSPIMADDNAARPNHTKYMPRVYTRITNLRIMRIHTTQHHLVLHLLDLRPHPRAEETRPRSKVARWMRFPHRVVRAVDVPFYLSDLCVKSLRTQRTRRLVVHGVVP
ncbi:carbohydrate esterase family 4 protein [Alternaria sp. MG1]|nr:carbohydrate esterase family 4 protein [Alternaria sp. MG1]